MRNPLFKIPICLLVLLAACNNEEATSPDLNASPVYMDYKVWGEEKKESVTCLLQFHQEDKNGMSRLVEAPASVSLDGQVLTPDSARLTGVFYERQVPLARFSGSHTIVYKDVNGKEYRETFQFQPLVLKKDLSGRVKRADLVLELAGVQPGEQVRVSLMDTAFATPDINHLFTPENNRITLSPEQLQSVASGPVTLFLYKEAERPLQHATPAGGHLSITYELSREFELVD